MNIQEAERRTQLTRANIRFYEKEGLIAPERQSNGYRNYSQADVDALLRIRLLRELGFSLQAVGQVQRGEADFQELLERRIRETEQEERRQQSIRAVCTSMREEGVQYATLNAQNYLNQYYRGLASPPRQTHALEADVVPPDPHPWRRWLARGLDNALLEILFLFVWCVPLHHFLSGVGDLATTVVGVILMLLVEPVMLHFFGTTPGKWLMGISIRNEDGEKPSWGQAWLRTWGVLRWGHGFYIPIYSIYRGYRCYKAEMAGETQEWDQEAETTLCFRDTYLWRPWVNVAAFGVLIAGMVFIGMASQLPPNRGDLTVEEFVENYRWYARQLGHDDTWELRDTGEFVRINTEMLVVPEPKTPAALRWTVEDGVLTAISMDIWEESRWDGNVCLEDSGNYNPQVQTLAALSLVGARASLFSCLDALNQAENWGREIETDSLTLAGVTLDREMETVGGEMTFWGNLIPQEGAETCRMEMTVALRVNE